MQVQDLVGRIRKTIGEPEPNGYGTQQPGQGTWDNSQIIGYLNEALGVMAHDWRKETTVTIAITSLGQTDFPFPADCLEDGLRAVSYVKGGTPYPVRFVDLDTYNKYATGISTPFTGQTTDYIYTVWAGTIKVWPQAAATTDTIQVQYFRLPATLVAAANTPEIPSRFHQALVYYGLRECQNAVEEVNLESDAGVKWERELMRFRVEMNKNQRDQGIRARGRR